MRRAIDYIVNGWDIFDYSTGNLWMLWFGAYGSIKVLVAERCLQDALEAAAEVLPKGVFTEVEYPNDNPTEQEREAAEADLTYTEQGWIPSWEWGAMEMTIEEAFKGWSFREAMDAIRCAEAMDGEVLPYGSWGKQRIEL